MNNNNEYQPEVITENAAYSRYDAMLDDVYGDVSIAGLHYSVSEAFKVMGPVAYYDGFLDYVDSMCEEFTVEGYYY